jgi:hypothetical protein
MGKRWTEGQINFLKENFMRMSNEELSSHLGYSVVSITTQMSRLGLCRSKCVKEKMIRNNGNGRNGCLSNAQKKLMTKFNKAVSLFQRGRYLDAKNYFLQLMNECTKEFAVYERARVYYNICLRFCDL